MAKAVRKVSRSQFLTPKGKELVKKGKMTKAQAMGKTGRRAGANVAGKGAAAKAARAIQSRKEMLDKIK